MNRKLLLQQITIKPNTFNHQMRIDQGNIQLHNDPIPVIVLLLGRLSVIPLNVLQVIHILLHPVLREELTQHPPGQEEEVVDHQENHHIQEAAEAELGNVH